MLGNTCNFTDFDVKLQTFSCDCTWLNKLRFSTMHTFKSITILGCDKNIFIPSTGFLGILDNLLNVNV